MGSTSWVLSFGRVLREGEDKAKQRRKEVRVADTRRFLTHIEQPLHLHAPPLPAWLAYGNGAKHRWILTATSETLSFSTLVPDLCASSSPPSCLLLLSQPGNLIFPTGLATVTSPFPSPLIGHLRSRSGTTLRLPVPYTASSQTTSPRRAPNISN